ncbi:SGNH/GDSL hydrolase family protein [Arthrobacter sp. zg-Y895]|uniref:SGNH/GDSL hydrolase family protein n=1 Tax=Arthrobacter sp. zg-Y895 TaxID=2886933 RepID=UPI001D137AF2|nr:SGNH/GDSL hydrolase family protein [Arthrobacter sp. zg-Y895]MCC3302929.1 SGNH/GDSL hydrolase family protein [Arthrobacter sp. zg-Y895]
MPTRHGRHISKRRSRRRRQGRKFVWFLVLAVTAGLVSAYALSQAPGTTSRTLSPRPSSTSTPGSPGTGEVFADSVVKIDVLGDSYTAGSVEGGRGAANWTRLVGTRFTDRGDTVELNVMAQPGSGYIARGNEGLAFREIATLRLREDTDVVLVFGSRNDGLQTDDAMYVAAKSLYSDVRDRAPGARIVAVGPVWPQDTAPDFIQANNEAMARAASEEDVRYVDALAAGWFAGDNTGLLSEDGVHPTDVGHDYLAGKIFPLLEDALREVRAA